MSMDVRTDRLAGARSTSLSSVARSRRPNGSPPILKARNPSARSARSCRHDLGPLLHQDGCVGHDPLPVSAAEQPAYRLAGDLAEDVPEGDVDGADGVRGRAPAAKRERVLMQLFRHALGFQRVLAAVQRLQHGEGGSYQMV